MCSVECRDEASRVVHLEQYRVLLEVTSVLAIAQVLLRGTQQAYYSHSSMAGTLRSPHATIRAPAGTRKAPADTTVFGYSPPPEIGLGRDVYKFLQRLDLSSPIQHPRRDLSNGFFVAEILSRFYAVSACTKLHECVCKLAISTVDVECCII